MPTIYDKKFPPITLLDKINSFKGFLRRQPFILLARPNDLVYKDENEKCKFISNIKYIIDKGLINLEIPWENNENWLDLMSDLKSNFPDIQLGSASLLNKKSVDDSLKIGLDFSMMRFWQKDLYSYSKRNNYLLIPGLKDIKDFKEAFASDCCIIKIYPVKNKDDLIDIQNNRKISFIGAGDIAIKNLKEFQSLGYEGLVIGSRGFNGEKFDQDIFKVLEANN